MTEQRPIQPTPVGAFRFNTDSARLEYFNGNEYVDITTDSSEKHGGTLALCGSMGNDAVMSNAVDKVNMSTTGNGVDYADLNYSNSQNGAFGSRTQSVFFGGYTDPASAVVTYHNSIRWNSNCWRSIDTSSTRNGIWTVKFNSWSSDGWFYASCITNQC